MRAKIYSGCSVFQSVEPMFNIEHFNVVRTAGTYVKLEGLMLDFADKFACNSWS